MMFILFSVTQILVYSLLIIVFVYAGQRLSPQGGYIGILGVCIVLLKYAIPRLYFAIFSTYFSGEWMINLDILSNILIIFGALILLHQWNRVHRKPLDSTNLHMKHVRYVLIMPFTLVSINVVFQTVGRNTEWRLGIVFFFMLGIKWWVGWGIILLFIEGLYGIFRLSKLKERAPLWSPSIIVGGCIAFWLLIIALLGKVPFDIGVK